MELTHRSPSRPGSRRRGRTSTTSTGSRSASRSHGHRGRRRRLRTGTCKVKLGPIALSTTAPAPSWRRTTRRTASSSRPRARTSAATAPPAPRSPDHGRDGGVDRGHGAHRPGDHRQARAVRAGRDAGVSEKLLGQFVACLEERLCSLRRLSAGRADARTGDDVQDAPTAPLPGAAATAGAAVAASGSNATPLSGSAGAANARTTRSGGVSGARKADPSDSLNPRRDRPPGAARRTGSRLPASWSSCSASSACAPAASAAVLDAEVSSCSPRCEFQSEVSLAFARARGDTSTRKKARKKKTAN